MSFFHLSHFFARISISESKMLKIEFSHRQLERRSAERSDTCPGIFRMPFCPWRKRLLPRFMPGESTCGPVKIRPSEDESAPISPALVQAETGRRRFVRLRPVSAAGLPQKILPPQGQEHRELDRDEKNSYCSHAALIKRPYSHT